VVGWALDNVMPTKLTKSALGMAIGRRNPSAGLIFHSDCGVQYASYEYQEYLRQYNIIQSMSAKNDYYDNTCAESLFHTLKKELIHGRKFKTWEEENGP
jgi:putative transposase